jgi:cobalt/nickel transport system permease protein
VHFLQGPTAGSDGPPDIGAAESAARLLIALVLLIAGLTVSARGHLEVCAYLLVALALCRLWGVRARDAAPYLRRAGLFLAVFIVLLVIFNWQPPFHEIRWGSVRLPVSPGALSFGLAVGERGLLAVLIGAGLFLSIGPTGLVAGLDRLHFPKRATTVLFLILRYAAVLAAEAGRIRTARRSRSLGRWWTGFFSLTGVSQSFLVRTYERSERVYLAMCSRGFDGRIPVLAGNRPGRGGWAALGGSLALIACLKIWFHRGSA